MPGLYHIQVQRHGSAPQPKKHVPSLPLRYSDGNLSVWADAPVLRIGDHGCLIGHLFSKGPRSVQIRSLPLSTIGRIVKTEGRSLVTDFWGAYVLVLRTQDARINVFRDPSGGLPCFSRFADGAIGFSSSSPILLADVNGSATINYVELARILQRMDAPDRSTALHSLSELNAGTAMVIGRGSVAVENWWSPWDYCQGTEKWHSANWEARLQETIQSCCQAWASCFRTPIIGVSGGLDSSIVTACLNTAGAKVRPFIMVAGDPEGDERHYAEPLAQALALPLSVHFYESTKIDIAKPPLPHLPWPIGSQFAHAVMAAHAKIHSEAPVDALFSGNGGDNVFCSILSASPLVDRLMVEGLGRGCWQTLNDLNKLTGSSITDVLRATWKRYHQRFQTYTPTSDDTGLSPGIIRRLQVPVPAHPWLQAPDGIPPGKAAHVRMIARAQKMHEYYPRDLPLPHIAPLLSQPVIELCLSIPTWEWISGGINRSPARSAFEALLPTAISKRISKGGPTAFMMQLYRRNTREIREMLETGLLMKHGIIDVEFLRRPYDPTPAGTAWAQRILAFAAAESWARWWTAPTRDPASHYWPAEALFAPGDHAS